jgi:hypothetical protein
MNLEAKISERLWAEVRANYEGRNFTGAILDSIYFLSDLVRQKTGLEADGVSLAGQALGGKNPKLKVNCSVPRSFRELSPIDFRMDRGGVRRCWVVVSSS